ncbi:beta-ketoacyl-[acyl-carrier-protein] synthase family protein [Desulfobacter vibrioformis]|uniref:beta-ketoacyl-[acyl-carrier-protein] synthase family protein n=1 Tax=Desulfobacter vibrioformis TaxID=34031 RepID=UPI00055666AB|nr:beta-ketoacyl synthase N-terminal-like domain-containing protein [Desulfobacter vibrioformis]
MNRRVVITGYGIISPIGDTDDEVIRHLTQGISGVKKLEDDGFLSGFIQSGVYGKIDYPKTYPFERNHRKTMGPVAFVACESARRAIEQSGLDKDFLTSGRVGVAFGSIHGSPLVQREIMRTYFKGGKDGDSGINAADFLKSMAHTTAVNITKMFGISGRVISPCTACTTSSQSIGFGYEAIRFGMQDAMVCGGADEYDTSTVAVFDNLRACSIRFNDTPHLTPRPFDSRRDGLVVGEGAGALVLESLDHAKNRGAAILGEVVGFASNNNGGDMILPNLAGITQTLTLALADAGIASQDVDFISAHATATRQGDTIEAMAIHDVYGAKTRVTALKSYMGHTIAACGAIETIITLMMMKHGFIPATLNLDTVDESCAMINHTRHLLDEKINTASVQNFAFGGVNTALILKKFN